VTHDALFGNGMRTNGAIRFSNASLDTLDFRGTEFFGSAENGVVAINARVANNFTWSELKRTVKTNLDLSYAQINQLSDEEASWPEQGKLRLEGLAYNSIAAGPVDAAKRLAWLRRQQPQYFSPQPYEQLVQVLRRSGHENHAKLVAMGKQDDRRRHGGMSTVAKLGNLLLKVTIGHGYRPQWALYWGLAIIFVLAAPIFEWGDGQGLMVPTNDKVLTSRSYKSKHTIPEYYPSFNPYMYSLEMFLPAVNIGQKQAWQPNDKGRCMLFGQPRPCGRMLRGLVWVEILAGWILTPLGLAAVSGLVRKD
jgi:hypothetical protein